MGKKGSAMRIESIRAEIAGIACDAVHTAFDVLLRASSEWRTNFKIQISVPARRRVTAIVFVVVIVCGCEMDGERIKIAVRSK